MLELANDPRNAVPNCNQTGFVFFTLMPVCILKQSTFVFERCHVTMFTQQRHNACVYKIPALFLNAYDLPSLPPLHFHKYIVQKVEHTMPYGRAYMSIYRSLSLLYTAFPICHSRVYVNGAKVFIVIDVK